MADPRVLPSWTSLQRRSRCVLRLLRASLFLVPFFLTLLFSGLAAGGCQDRSHSSTSNDGEASSSAVAPAEAASAEVAPGLIIALGDSLTAGYGLPTNESYPSLLAKHLAEEGYSYRVINAGVSGDTSAGGLARLSWVLREPADVLIVALGANDGLRGLSTAELEKNLEAILIEARPRAKHLVLAGMQMPTNFDAAYRRQFAQVFADLAVRHEVIWIPFLLEGIALRPELNQSDGIHPNTEGAQVLERTVYEAIRPALQHR